MPTASGQPSMMEAILAGEQVRMTISNRDICFAEPVQSVIDGTHYSSKRAYTDHLRQHECHEVGNDYNTGTHRPSELQGDFDVRKELAAATYETLRK